MSSEGLNLPRLSVIIITRNEAANIADCLDSVAFADERIVVDGGSEDDTVQIANSKGARVLSHPWQGFGVQKNFALAQATGDWVFSIDADERVGPALAAAIEKAMNDRQYDGFEMPRRSIFCGRAMRFSGWYPDRVLRLFRRGRGNFTDDIVHERVVCDGKVGRLSEPLTHRAVLKLEDALVRLDRYSTASAEMKLAAGRRVSFMTGIGHGLFAFFKAYVLRAGFLDGREGFLLAVLIAEHSYYGYMKAWLRSRDRK